MYAWDSAVIIFRKDIVFMAVLSIMIAVVTAVIVSLFSGFPGFVPVFLFFVLLLINCECMAANACEDDQTSILFMAVICSGLVVLLCGMVFAGNLNIWLCDKGVQDPDRVHPLVPLLTILFTVSLYRFFLRRASAGRLLIQRYGEALTSAAQRHLLRPDLKRYRRFMIQEGILTERLDEDENE